MFHLVPVLIPFSFGHIFWTWSISPPPFYPYPNPSIFHTNPPPPYNPGDYSGLYGYSTCAVGRFWSPGNVTCVQCYCINGFVSKCYVNSSCSTSTTTSIISTTPPLPPVITTFVPSDSSAVKAFKVPASVAQEITSTRVTPKPLDDTGQQNTREIGVTTTSSISTKDPSLNDVPGRRLHEFYLFDDFPLQK